MSYKRTIDRKRRLVGVLECLNQGMSNEEIAEEFGVSIRTIQRDVTYINKVKKNKKDGL